MHISTYPALGASALVEGPELLVGTLVFGQSDLVQLHTLDAL